MTVKKTNLGSDNVVSEFHPSVPMHVAPKVLEQYMNDEGDIIYVLDNGRESKQILYDAMWKKPKGTINWKSKGINPNHRNVF